LLVEQVEQIQVLQARQEQITHWHHLVCLPLVLAAVAVELVSLYLVGMVVQADSQQVVEVEEAQRKLAQLLAQVESVAQGWQ
jgi:hypothetical protein